MADWTQGLANSLSKFAGDWYYGANLNQNPSTMNNYEFNRWAESNPQAAANYGKGGGMATSANMGGPQYSGSIADTSTADLAGTMGTAMSIGDLAMKGLGAWTAMEQLDLAKDAFNYNKMDRDRAYNMSKDAYDREVKRADSIGSQMQAGKVG